MTEPVDPASTIPPTQPTFAPVADLFSARTRTWIYMLTAVAAAVWLVVEANTAVHWIASAAYAGWNAFAGLLAVSNVPRTTVEVTPMTTRGPRGGLGI